MAAHPRRVATEWMKDGRRVVAATLVSRIGSSPLDPGAEMFIDDGLRVEGTVTGGCVESSLVESAELIFKGPDRSRHLTFGVSDEAAAEVGLMCGGTVEVFLHELDRRDLPALDAVVDLQGRELPVALATALSGPDAGTKMAVNQDGIVGSLGSPLLDHNVEREALGMVDDGVTRTRSYGPEGEVMGDDRPVLIQVFQEPPQLIIYGAIDYSVALAKLAREVGYRVVICDARRPFAEGRRFSEVAEVVVDWPDRDLAGRVLGPRDAVLIFTHDPKFDQPALMEALESGAGYVGALGSRRTQADREKRLRECGLSSESLVKLHAPCGLDLGARTPEETAISILAEIVASRTGRSGFSLQETSGPIHSDVSSK